MVIIYDVNHPRNLWKLGKVTDLIKGDDGQIRGAVLNVFTNGKPQTLRRPITHLYPLEVMSKFEVNSKQSSSDQDDKMKNVIVDNSVFRSVRAAAERARHQVLE